MSRKIPLPVLVVAGDILGQFYTHREIDLLFVEQGVPGDPPEGNKVIKCTAWLKRLNKEDEQLDRFGMLGRLLEQFMEVDAISPENGEWLEISRERVRTILGKHGLSYHQGGQILGVASGGATISLEATLRKRSLSTLEAEFQRALSNLDTDPAAAVTAACAILEALCKVYIEDEGLEMPSKETAKPLWSVVQKHLGLDPSQLVDDDLKRILTGLSSIVDGIGCLRTHAGSAHGRGRRSYRIESRHARLAVHASHTWCSFVLETWEARKTKPV